MKNTFKTAIHEAGHTVIRYRNNLCMGNITIIPKDNYWGASGGEESWGSKEAAEVDILISLAGYGAVIAAGFDEEIAVTGCGQDFDQAKEQIDGWQLGNFEDWKERIAEIMRQPDNIRAVKVLSDALIKYECIDGECATVLIEFADGEGTEDELLAYLTRFPQGGGRTSQ